MNSSFQSLIFNHAKKDRSLGKLSLSHLRGQSMEYNFA